MRAQEGMYGRFDVGPGNDLWDRARGDRGRKRRAVVRSSIVLFCGVAAFQGSKASDDRAPGATSALTSLNMTKIGFHYMLITSIDNDYAGRKKNLNANRLGIKSQL